MSFLNADIPQFECFVRAEYLYDFEAHHGEFVPVVVFGLASIPGRALGFHVMTDVGAVIWRLPISALCWRQDAPALSVETLELWDCASYDVAVHEFAWLTGSRCMTVLKDGSRHEGECMFTVDWCGSAEAEAAGDIGHKCAHVIRLDNGCFAAQPNNRILWASPAFVAKPFAVRPDYRTSTRIWRAEMLQKWATEDSARMFYDVERG